MGYSSIQEINAVLGQALTSARPDATVNQQIQLININEVRDLNRISDDIVEFYISLADSQIDGILSQQYFTPFSKCQDGQWNLEEDINPNILPHSSGSSGLPNPSGSTTTVVIDDTSVLIPGDQITIIDDINGYKWNAYIDSVTDQNNLVVTEPITQQFLVINNVRVTRIKFPPPLNQISARYAASFIYDKYFSAQSAPNISDYGKEMRNIAMGQLNDILNGKVILRCARRKGDLFGNAYLDDSYQHRDRGYSTSERNMSKLT